ncbi:MAG: metal ABC transporter permease [Desulforegulaceae bacterium]|nr:metal ABC transporter permease [Desulforegulaceae bacterium]
MNFLVEVFSDPTLVFLKYSLLAGIFSSFAFGITGSYIVVKRISYMAGAISHSVLGGIGFALFISAKFNIPWITPYSGAVAASIFSAVLIWFAEKYSKERLDSLLGAVWATGMAGGIIFIALTPGYIDPMSYLFGNILMVTKTDLIVIALFSSLICFTAFLFQNKLIAASFDEEFLKIRGVRTDIYNLMLLIMTALTIVLMIRIVGIIMIIAMLTLPPASASRLSKNFFSMSILSIVLSAFFVISGIGISFKYDLPGGPAIILTAGVFYFSILFLTSKNFIIQYLGNLFKNKD